VIAAGIEGELAEDGAVLSDRLQVGSGNEKGDRLPAMPVAHIEMTEPAQVTDCDLAAGVEAVATDSAALPSGGSQLNPNHQRGTTRHGGSASHVPPV